MQYRYFLISFNELNTNIIGHVSFSSEQFPSFFEIKKVIGKEIVITNIFEFKNEEDYLNFNS